MLQHCGKIFFRVATIDRKNGVPTIFLDVLERRTGNFIGQIRFNHDSNYAKEYDFIRMSFDVMLPFMADPSTNANYLEDIIVGGIVWLTKDNHRTYQFTPNVYVVVHSYDSDTAIMQPINQKTIEILKKLDCESSDEVTWTFSSKKNHNYSYIFERINDYHI